MTFVMADLVTFIRCEDSVGIDKVEPSNSPTYGAQHENKYSPTYRSSSHPSFGI